MFHADTCTGEMRREGGVVSAMALEHSQRTTVINYSY